MFTLTWLAPNLLVIICLDSGVQSDKSHNVAISATTEGIMVEQKSSGGVVYHTSKNTDCADMRGCGRCGRWVWVR
jgi:hypothetical protein